MGSPLYMSPEQMRSAKDVDAQTDLWAIGVILFELITGRPVFLGESVTELATTAPAPSPQATIVADIALSAALPALAPVAGVESKPARHEVPVPRVTRQRRVQLPFTPA
jgi:serine/threonine protein kinase